jgi:hypothetical protein
MTVNAPDVQPAIDADRASKPRESLPARMTKNPEVQACAYRRLLERRTLATTDGSEEIAGGYLTLTAHFDSDPDV